MEDLLTQNINACGTVRMIRRGFPDDLTGKLELQKGESLTRQKGNFTALVWQDKKPVAFLSTLMILVSRFPSPDNMAATYSI